MPADLTPEEVQQLADAITAWKKATALPGDIEPENLAQTHLTDANNAALIAAFDDMPLVEKLLLSKAETWECEGRNDYHADDGKVPCSHHRSLLQCFESPHEDRNLIIRMDEYRCIICGQITRGVHIFNALPCGSCPNCRKLA